MILYKSTGYSLWHKKNMKRYVSDSTHLPKIQDALDGEKQDRH